jgi:hypothetical protein
MSTRTLRFFTHSAAALLLATASALFLINLTGPVHLVQPHDPIFAISLRYMFWIIGGIAVLVALFCLFSERPAQPTAWVAWLAANFLLYRIGLYCDGCHDLTGFLGSFSYAFGIPAKTANTLANLVFAYLLIGSCAALLWQWRHSSKNPSIHHSTPENVLPRVWRPYRVRYRRPWPEDSLPALPGHCHPAQTRSPESGLLLLQGTHRVSPARHRGEDSLPALQNGHHLEGTGMREFNARAQRSEGARQTALCAFAPLRLCVETRET